MVVGLDGGVSGVYNSMIITLNHLLDNYKNKLAYLSHKNHQK